jgi:hypothetical protein
LEIKAEMSKYRESLEGRLGERERGEEVPCSHSRDSRDPEGVCRDIK